MANYEEYIVTDNDFQRAVANASAFAKARVFKKMTKVPMPKDVEEYVKNFVWQNKDKHEKG